MARDGGPSLYEHFFHYCGRTIHAVRDVAAGTKSYLRMPVHEEPVVGMCPFKVRSMHTLLPPPHLFCPLARWCGGVVGAGNASRENPLATCFHSVDHVDRGDRCDVMILLTTHSLESPHPIQLNCQCDGAAVTVHDPPAVFDLGLDPSESHPLDPASAAAVEASARAAAAVAAHKADLGPLPPSQLEVWARPWLCPAMPAQTSDGGEL